MSDRQVKVVFTPSGRRGAFPEGTPVLQAAQALGVDIDSVCGGRGLCGRCQVLCAEGTFPKHGLTSKSDHLSPFSETEKRYSEKRSQLAKGRRLSCQSLLLDDVVIDVPEESQVHRQIVRKEVEHRDIELNASVKLYYIQVEEADMHNPKGDLQRIYEALKNEWGLEELDMDNHLLSSLQSIVRQGDWYITVAVYQDARIVSIWPGFVANVYGLAIDLGSTTVAAHICDLTTGEVLATGSRMNPQIRFGEDLMSRVSYVMMHPEGAEDMTEVIREAIGELAKEIADRAEIDIDRLMEITLVANPVMHHIFLGINPIELGGAPFALATDSAMTLRAQELDLPLQPGTRVHVLPCIAGHVGADTAGVILSEEPQLQDLMTLVVDVGTNAEIVLGNKDKLVACSSPTGPAFEGAQITCGQRAAAGAIERVRIDPVTKEPRFRVIGSDKWSDEEGFEEETATTGITGICGSGIIEVVAEMFLAGVLDQDGVIDGSLSATNPRLIQEQRTWSYVLHEGATQIRVTQNDVRQIQLAKAALYAGVRLLMDELETDKVERIRLAGAFGSHIDVKHAMVLGLIPDCDLEQVSSAGNAAGTGARIALLNSLAREEIQQTVEEIEKIETAVEPKFQEYFVDAMAFPHKTDDFPHLFSVVSRPPAKVVQTDESENSGRRRRRRGSR